jgi:hypothetical protein
MQSDDDTIEIIAPSERELQDIGLLGARFPLVRQITRAAQTFFASATLAQICTKSIKI